MSDKAISSKEEAQQPRRSHAKSVLSYLISFGFIVTLMRYTPESYHPGCYLMSRFGPKTLEQRVHRILSETPLIDGHNDLAISIRGRYNDHIYNETFATPFEQGGLPGHVDLPRLRAGQNGGAFWSVFAPCPSNGSDWSDENYAATVQLTLQQIDLVRRLQKAYPDDLSGVVNAESAVAAFKQGKIISPMGVEGLHQIGNSMANLRLYHALGVRYVTLTHNCGNRFADAALTETPKFGKAPPYWGGLSPLGRKVVQEMNRIGLMVDLSHVSADTMRDVLGGGAWSGSKAAVIFSHSSAFAICPHPRNVPDDVLELVKQTNSVVMVSFAPDFISCEEVDGGETRFVPETNTLDQVARHVTYIGDLIGYDHVGLGSDFNGIPATPKGLDDVSKYPDLVADLLRRGVSDEDAAKVVGGNILRVWKDSENVAAKLRVEGEPVLEDDLPSL